MQVNKEKIRERVYAIKEVTVADDKGQFELGHSEQRHAAEAVELFIKNFDIIKNDEELMTETTAAVLLALRDIQVRDYAMGLLVPEDTDKTIPILQWLHDAATSDTVAAPATLLALTYYQKSDVDKAFELLNIGKGQGYSLANLLGRVFGSGWPVAAFHAMQMELHPKVTAGIFGESDDSSK
jgi:hypothetical protein